MVIYLCYWYISFGWIQLKSNLIFCSSKIKSNQMLSQNCYGSSTANLFYKDYGESEGNLHTYKCQSYRKQT